MKKITFVITGLFLILNLNACSKCSGPGSAPQQQVTPPSPESEEVQPPPGQVEESQMPPSEETTDDTGTEEE